MTESRLVEAREMVDYFFPDESRMKLMLTTINQGTNDDRVKKVQIKEILKQYRVGQTLRAVLDGNGA